MVRSRLTIRSAEILPEFRGGCQITILVISTATGGAKRGGSMRKVSANQRSTESRSWDTTSAGLRPTRLTLSRRHTANITSHRVKNVPRMIGTGS